MHLRCEEVGFLLWKHRRLFLLFNKLAFKDALEVVCEGREFRVCRIVLVGLRLTLHVLEEVHWPEGLHGPYEVTDLLVIGWHQMVVGRVLRDERVLRIVHIHIDGSSRGVLLKQQGEVGGQAED